MLEEEKKPNMQREQVKNPTWKNVQKTKENSPFENKLISILNKKELKHKITDTDWNEEIF